ncbi:MAG: hypothetical protein HYV09_16340 [Deltaproteobacteria bacterium]|nr:hypothetical protein [Deltaproteobacteria bacterium]
MTDQAVAERLRHLGRRAKLPHFSPHDMRRSFVYDLLDAGATLRLQYRAIIPLSAESRHVRKTAHILASLLAALFFPLYLFLDASGHPLMAWAVAAFGLLWFAVGMIWTLASREPEEHARRGPETRDTYR